MGECSVNLNMNRKFTLITIILLLVSGCVPLAPQNTPAPRPTNLPTEIPKSSENSGSFSETRSTAITPYLSPTLTPDFNTGVIQNCISVKPELPKQHPYTGKIVFETLPPQDERVYSFFDLSSGKATEIPGRNYSYLSVSPDRSMYAYKNWDENQLEVYGSDGKIIRKLPWKQNWGSIDGWIDNQHLIIVMAVIDVPGFVKYPRAITILNPLENKEKILEPNYPNIDIGNTNVNWPYMGTTVYNPSLSRVVYPGSLENSPSGGYQGFILYGIPEKAVLAEFDNPYWSGEGPYWSLDGSHLLLLVNREFYIVSPDGIPEVITQMNPLEGKRNYTAEFYSWSPDNKTVAFRLLSYETEEFSLAFLDTKTGMITNTCILAGFEPDYYTTFPYPIWSKDGKSLVIAANYQKDPPGNDVVLVNLAEKSAFIIAKNLSPVGWVENP